MSVIIFYLKLNTSYSQQLGEGHELLVRSIKIDDSNFSSLEPLC